MRNCDGNYHFYIPHVWKPNSQDIEKTIRRLIQQLTLSGVLPKVEMISMVTIYIYISLLVKHRPRIGLKYDHGTGMSVVDQSEMHSPCFWWGQMDIYHIKRKSFWIQENLFIHQFCFGPSTLSMLDHLSAVGNRTKTFLGLMKKNICCLVWPRYHIKWEKLFPLCELIYLISLIGSFSLNMLHS